MDHTSIKLRCLKEGDPILRPGKSCEYGPWCLEETFTVLLTILEPVPQSRSKSVQRGSSGEASKKSTTEPPEKVQGTWQGTEGVVYSIVG